MRNAPSLENMDPCDVLEDLAMHGDFSRVKELVEKDERFRDVLPSTNAFYWAVRLHAYDFWAWCMDRGCKWVSEKTNVFSAYYALEPPHDMESRDRVRIVHALRMGAPITGNVALMAANNHDLEILRMVKNHATEHKWKFSAGRFNLYTDTWMKLRKEKDETSREVTEILLQNGIDPPSWFYSVKTEPVEVKIERNS